MTMNGAKSLGRSLEEGAMFRRSSRPSLVSQHSNSVPSTPLQTPRQYESRSRSPSPNGGLGSHSPRSVSSEANSTMPTLRSGRVFRCKYETNTAFGRRRIPYTSSDILASAPEEPKKTLDPLEDKKLTDDMRALYDRLLPSADNSERRDKLVTKLQFILETEFPGSEAKVHVFGSSGNLLYTSESDVDICIQTPAKRLEEMHPLAEALAKHGMENVVCVPQARVKIVKIWDPILKLNCDMNVNNTLALENTRMIKTCVQIDERVRPLAMIIKYWTKQRILNDAALGGTISSYTWICMILNFLQTRNPPILPPLQSQAGVSSEGGSTTHSGSTLADDLGHLGDLGSKNHESLGQLLFQFFRLYGHEVDYEKKVVSVRQGRLVERKEKNWHLAGLQKEARNRLCVEEPFNTDRNLGNSADDFAWRGIHLEIRRAFDMLVDAQQLDKACDRYEWPPEEKSTALFVKPQSIKPTLTPSAPARSGRGFGGHRGGRGGGFSQKSGNYGRRASSGASHGPNRPPMPLQSPPMSAIPAPEYFAARGLNDQLHDQLYHQYQMLEFQSNTLRAQLVARERAQQARQAQVQAAHFHAHAVAHNQGHQRGQGNANGSPQKTLYVNGRASPRLADASLANTLPPGFLYTYPGFFDPLQGTAVASQDGPRTNPSSPSLTNSVPSLRRQVHRVSNASETGGLRSHSQPPRGVLPQTILANYAPMPQFYDPASFAGYPPLQPMHHPESSHDPVELQSSPPKPSAEPATSAEQATPKEYVGYYVEEEAAPRPRQLQDYNVQPIPSFSELALRRRKASQETSQSLLGTAMRRISRSPSPLGGHVRSYSSTVAASAASNAEQHKSRTENRRPSNNNGPVIVNGSYPAPPAESRTRSGTLDSLVAIEGLVPMGTDFFAHQSPLTGSNPGKIQANTLGSVQQDTSTAYGQSPVIANGSIGASMATDPHNVIRIPSGGQQPFPSLPEEWRDFGRSQGTADNYLEDVSPTRTQAPHWRSMPQPNGLHSLETSNSQKPPAQDVKSAPLPLLSPVFETRTPSPVANRQGNAGRQANGANHKGKELPKENTQQGRRSSHSPAQAATSKSHQANPSKTNPQHEKGKAQLGTPQSSNGAPNEWIQSTASKKRRAKRGPAQGQGSSKSNGTKQAGEPLPVNAADRKGG